MNPEEVVEKLLINYRQNPTIENRNLVIQSSPCQNKIDALVFYYCKKRGNVDLNDDLRQESILATIQAIEYYKYNGKFLACLGFWIKKYIINYYNNVSKQVSVPKGYRMTMKAILNYSNEFECKFGRTPKKHEISRGLKISERRISSVSYYLKDTIPIEEAIIAHSVQDNSSRLVKEEVSEIVKNCISKLNSREQFIINEIYGFNCEPQTYKQVSIKLKMSFQQAHQINKKACQKLKRTLLKKI